MSRWSRLTNVFRQRRVVEDIDEELQSHIDEAVAHGRDAGEARRALGSNIRLREESRDARLNVWLDSVRSDVVFGFRQLRKRPIASGTAIVSLALAIGACTAAFRVMDALLWRPLPVAHADRLFALSLGGITPEGRYDTVDRWSYPSFTAMQEAVKTDATLLAISPAEPVDIAIGSSPDLERVSMQYVSGAMFGEFQIRPALGRLLTAADDDTPGAHPYAVLSHAFWRNRFGSDPQVVGKSFRVGSTLFTIVGVTSGSFLGTEPGVVVDVFVPTAMHRGVTHDDWTWLRAMAIIPSPESVEPVRARTDAVWHAFERNRAMGFVNVPQAAIDANLAVSVRIDPAPSGASATRADFETPLKVLAGLVAMVLLIACANLANLFSAQSATRAAEMALRVSIGAGRARLVQLVVVEGALVATSATVLGALFAEWAAPAVVALASSGKNPTNLSMPFDLRVTLFAGVMVTLAVLLVSVWPAMRAAAIQPLSVLRRVGPRHTGRSISRSLISAQVAFCVFVLFVAGLSVKTFSQLTHRPLGFETDEVSVLDVATTQPQSLARWQELTESIERLPGVSSVALAGWPLLAGRSWNGFVSVEGAPSGTTLAEFLNVSPAFIDAMGIRLVAGRSFGPSDTQPGQAIVTEAFVREFLNGRPPLGVRFAKGQDGYEIVGVVQDIVYRDIHQAPAPLAFVPFRNVTKTSAPQTVGSAAMIVRSAVDGGNPTALRSAIRGTGSQFRIRSIVTQQSIVDAQLIRERLMALLAAFFASVAVVLTCVGLYSMLHYTVIQRQREIGIRRAIGARLTHIVATVTGDTVVILAGGVIAGLGAGIWSGRLLERLLYGTSETDVSMVVTPVAVVVAASLLALLAPLARALRIDPASILRAD